MIKRLIWTIWTPMSSVLKKADKLNLSLSLSAFRHLRIFSCDQAVLWMVQSVCLYVRHTFLLPSGLEGYCRHGPGGRLPDLRNPYLCNLLTDFRQSPFKVPWNCLGLYCSCALSGLSVDIFCWGSGAPTIWISKGPQQNLEGPFIEIHYQLSNFGGPLGPQAKFHKGPIGFSGARGPYLRAPECPDCHGHLHICPIWSC